MIDIDPVDLVDAERYATPTVKMPEMIVLVDPPRHVPMRRVISARFTPKAVRERHDEVGHITAGILDEAVTGDNVGECDFVEKIAAPSHSR